VKTTTQTIEFPSYEHLQAQFHSINPNLLAAGGCMLLLLIVMPFVLVGKADKRKGLLARARFATAQELNTSNRRAFRVVQSLSRGGPHNRVALWIRQPDHLAINHEKRIINLPYDANTLFLNKLQEMLLVLGSTGSGKSFSILDPLKRAAILLGLPIIDFDFKGYEEDQSEAAINADVLNFLGKGLCPSSRTAGFALQHGYNVYTIGPGFRDSDRCNPLSFMDSPIDADKAYAMSACLNENFKLNGEAKPDFFSMSSDQLIQAIFMLAKGLEKGADLATCHKILALPNLIQRIQAADLPQYQKVAFDQFLSSAGSPETAASIASTASTIFSRFQTPAVLSVFCGQTTIPLDLTGRVMIIFRVNPKIKTSVLPLIASILYMLLIRNIYQPRKDPLCVFLDEFARFKLPDLSDLLNVARSNGGCFFLGAQSIPGIEKVYGKQETESILSGTKTQIIGQLNDLPTAEYFTKLLGKEDISHTQKSRGGGKGGSTHNLADQLSVRDLVEVQQWGNLSEGEFYFLSPGTQAKAKKGRTEVRLPFFKHVTFSEAEIQQMKAGEMEWLRFRPGAIARSKAKPLSNDQLKAREVMAAQVMPLPQPPVRKEKPEVPKASLALVKAMF
jgi:TraM recognition site of TraD and TraG